MREQRQNHSPGIGKLQRLSLVLLLLLNQVQPTLAQKQGRAQAADRQGAKSTKPADRPQENSTVEQKPGILPAQKPQQVPAPSTAGLGDADSSFVSQTQASQKTNQLKADESSGALHYDYPLPVPPGRNGLQPDLKLSYNSQNLEEGSIFGYGWTIGIPYLQRKNTHGTDKLYSSFDFISALSGDLVPTDAGNSTFIARVEEGQYLKYRLDSNQVWTAQTKQGLTYVFGATASDRQDDPTNSSHVYTWLLSSIIDSNGNTVTYTYVKDKGQVYPDKISYSGIFEVSFSRTTRQDPYRGYRTGFAVTSDYVVSSIVVKENNSIIKSYLLTYSNNPTTTRSRLDSVSVQDETRTFPATRFDYQIESAKGFNPSWSSPSIPIDLKSGVFPADINSDGYPDLVKAYEWNYVFYSSTKSVSISHPESSNWQIDPAWQLPPKIMIDTDGAWNRNVDSGTRVIDLNGDLKPDFLRYENICFICTTDQEVNTGLGWIESPQWFSPINTNGGTRTVLDLNGDGLTDVIGTNGVSGTIQNFQTSVSLNNGMDFVTYSHYTSAPPDPSLAFTDAPEYLSNYLEVDVNADGLPDLVKSSWYWGNPTSRWEKKIYLNTGKGWAEDTTWSFPDVCYFCQGAAGQTFNAIYFQDFNSDGYVDFAVPGGANVNNQQLSYSNVYINNGHGWSEDTGWYSLAYFYSDNCYCQNPALFFDGNADGSPDIYVSNQGASGPPSTNIFENKNHNQVDLLSTVTLPTGGTMTVGYKTSAQYRDDAGNLLNPKLPLVIQTVERITTDDKNGNSASVTYSYGDGSYYYNGPFDRRFAGFGSITTTDAGGNVTKTYLHQGNESNQILGESNDEPWKIGKPYRIERYDSAGALYSRTVNTWDSLSLGSNAKFVRLARVVEYSFDGHPSHKDKAETYSYDDNTGNVTQKVSWGEVSGNVDGSFTDLGNDAMTTTISYATGSSANVTDRPSQEVAVDQSGNKVKESKYFYDTLTFGQVDKGNLTRKEDWTSGGNYIHTTRTYNNLGLVIQETDGRDKATTFAYDAFNLYPATVTNALDQTTQFLYDYASGKLKEKTDANGNVFQTSYDGLGRVLEEKVPDVSTNSLGTMVRDISAGRKRPRPRAMNAVSQSLVTKTLFVYNDNGLGSSVKKTDFLSTKISTDNYAYLDGFGRAIQTRKQAEAANTYAVKDLVYNNLGLLQQESFPYFSTGTAKTTASDTSSLYTSYTYDAQQRLQTVATAVGTITNTYNSWKLTVTDAKGISKDLYKDAYGNLVQVDEHNSGTTYSTYYSHDHLGSLTKVTDAMGNIRSFTYDGLGRRLTAQDLHLSGDATFGSYSFAYDDNGNLTQKVDPNGNIVTFTYDDLNRPLTEDYAGHQGTEVVYVYDEGDNGIGRLTTVSGPTLIQSNGYNALGQLITESKEISGTGYNTAYHYDRQGNITQIDYPDLSSTKYLYNAAGLLETVQYKQLAQTEYADIISNFDYSPLGQPATIAYANGVISTNSYDATRLYRLVNKVSLKGTNHLQDLTYDYDVNGNIIEIVDASNTSAAKTVHYAYDDLSRLISASANGVAEGQSGYAETYEYNAIGNLTRKNNVKYSYLGNTGSSYANPHAATTVGETQFTYDRNGNVITQGSDFVYTWDYNNRMVQTGVNLGANISYAYDPSGQRIFQSNGSYATTYPNKYYNIDSAGIYTKHIFAGGMSLASIQSTGEVSRIGDPVPEAVRYTLPDHLTGANVVTDANGSTVELLDYLPFGKIRIDEQTATYAEQRKFSGHEYDRETGLSYMGARYYEAGTGRFLSQDPAFWSLGNGTGLKPINSQEPSAYISDPQKLNSYSYAENNPISKYDPTGTFSINIFGFLPESTQVSIGNAAQYLYDNNGTWRTAMDHPVVAGASIGVLSGASAYAGAAGLTYLSINSLGGIGTACIALCGQTSQQLDRAADYVGRYGPELGSKMNQISNRLGDKDYDEHAILRMAERNVSVDRVENLLHTKPFEYFHDGQTKLGYYDEASKLFVAQSKAGHVITVISNASQKYVNGLIGN